MKKNTAIFLFITLALISAVSHQPSFFHSVTGGDEIPEPDQLMGKIIDKSAQEISKKYGFLPIGVGLSGNFRQVSISFRVFRPLEKDQFREILFDCAEILLKNINSSSDIQDYLEAKPFTLRNVGIMIYSTNEKYQPFLHPYPAVANIGVDGLMFFYEEEGSKGGYKEIAEETIEEARAILNKSMADSQGGI